MKKVFFLILFIPFISFSQKHIQGKVIDSKTKKPLAFATVITNTNFGTLTDVDGNFQINAKGNFSSISVSYVGYKTTEFQVEKDKKFITIKLKQVVENLNEIVITASENPALQIIRNSISNKKKNNLEQSLNSFKFKSYNKILVTANPDSVSGSIDTVFVVKDGKKVSKKIDSSNFKFKNEIIKQHLYISEKISEYQFQKGKKTKEVVLGSRMAGLKQPVYELLAVTLQDFSFYNEYYVVAGTKYINPIANNALKHYYYKILDTVINEQGTSYMIHFKPKEKKEIIGLEGVLYLDTQSYAITKAIAELKGIVNIKTTQNYNFSKEYNIWLPSNNHIIIKKGDNNENIALFGGVVQFSKSNPKSKNDSINVVSTSKKNESDFTYFISKTYNSNFEINIPLKIRKSAATIQFADNSHKRDTTFWNTYRTESLSRRGENAYKFIDSIAKDENIESKINLARNVLKGYLPTKYVNLDLGKMINLNNYEGLRVGLGGETNSNFSNKIKLESYVAYGTKDRDYKYNIGASVRLNKELNTWFGVKHTNDLKEAAALNFIAENNSFSPINPRNLNISKFYNYKTISTFLEHDIQPNLEAKIELSTGNFTPVFDYQYIRNNEVFEKYSLTTATFGFQYNPKNEYMNSPVGKLRTKNAFPQFTFQIVKSFESVFNSDFEFTQLNFRMLQKFKPLRKATTSLLAEAGYVFGDAPISHLFNATPNYTFKQPWAKRVTFAGKNSFETMGYNEFISDKFIALHLKHEFLPFNIGKKFKPQLTLASRAAFGDIENPENHLGLPINSMKKGYFESGLEFNGLFKGFGLSTFYRYGPYKNDDWSDNLALKLTFKIRLGI